MYFDRNIDISEKIGMAKKQGQLFVSCNEPRISSLDDTETEQETIQVSSVALMYSFFAIL